VGKITKKQSEEVRAILSKIHSYRLLFSDFAHWITTTLLGRRHNIKEATSLKRLVPTGSNIMYLVFSLVFLRRTSGIIRV